MKGMKDGRGHNRWNNNRRRNWFLRLCGYLMGSQKGDRKEGQKDGGGGDGAKKAAKQVSPTSNNVCKELHDHGTVRQVGDVSCGPSCSVAKNQRDVGKEHPKGFNSVAEHQAIKRKMTEDVTGKITLVKKNFPNNASEIAELRRSTQSRKKIILGLKTEVAKLNQT